MPEDSIGFIYKIRKKITGEFYIGRKSLYSHRTLPPLKGTKRKKKGGKRIKLERLSIITR